MAVYRQVLGHRAASSSPIMPSERRTIHFSGRVQGVGFRMITYEIVSRFQVGGFVENLLDGRVLLVVEGEPAELDRFLEALNSRMQRYIESIESRTSPATGEFGRFEIRH